VEGEPFVIVCLGKADWKTRVIVRGKESLSPFSLTSSFPLSPRFFDLVGNRNLFRAKQDEVMGPAASGIWIHRELN
jgi:hypothetical protein